MAKTSKKSKTESTEVLALSEEKPAVASSETHGHLRLRGFAAMSPDKRRELGSKGGKTAHARGTANKFTSESASRAGKISHARGTAHKWTSEEAREAGRKGGASLRDRHAK